jgi:hypothetical protein
MTTFTPFDTTGQRLIEGVHAFGTHAFKAFLTNTAPVNTNALYGDISSNEVANGNGYTTGGIALTITTGQTSGVAKATISADITWTATGSLGPFRYLVVVNTTPTSPLKPLWARYDYGSSVTLAINETFTADFDQTGGFFTEQ